IHDEPPSLRGRAPGLPRDLETITIKCLSKDPGRRYPSARALAEDLGRYIEGEPILGRRPGLLERLVRQARRHRAVAVVSAASLVLVLAAASVGLRSCLAERDARRRAAECAALAEHLGRDVKDMEWLLYAAHVQPLHDTSVELALVRRRMEKLSSLKHDLGD